jgi:hypothetical protein
MAVERFTVVEVAEQEIATLRSRMAGVSFAQIATQMSSLTSDGEPIDEDLVRHRFLAAIHNYRVSQEQVEAYKGVQMAQIDMAIEKVMAAVIKWDTRHHHVADLTSAVISLRRLQERADTLIEEQKGARVVPDELEGRRGLTRKPKSPGSRQRTKGG